MWLQLPLLGGSGTWTGRKMILDKALLLMLLHTGRLSSVLSSFNNVMYKMNKINIKKTKTTVISNSTTKLTITITLGIEEVEQVKNFVYLGQ